jgi:hypothetical protein
MKEAKQDRGLKPGCASLQLGSGS